jgi:hypothetical protein
VNALEEEVLADEPAEEPHVERDAGRGIIRIREPVVRSEGEKVELEENRPDQVEKHLGIGAAGEHLGIAASAEKEIGQQ